MKELHRQFTLAMRFQCTHIYIYKKTVVFIILSFYFILLDRVSPPHSTFILIFFFLSQSHMLKISILGKISINFFKNKIHNFQYKFLIFIILKSSIKVHVNKDVNLHMHMRIPADTSNTQEPPL